jgi:hypothetical protein
MFEVHHIFQLIFVVLFSVTGTAMISEAENDEYRINTHGKLLIGFLFILTAIVLGIISMECK